MKKIIYILGAALMLNGVSSCNTDFLEQKPVSLFAESAVWNDPALVQTFVNNIYFGIPHGHANVMLSSAADESMVVWGLEADNVTKNQITPSYLGLWDENSGTGARLRVMAWGNAYKNIRACNLFLEKIESVPFDNENDKNRLMGEVHFLRAHLYHNLVSLYGGVPILTKTYDLKDDFKVSRDSYEACVNFITEECDKAAALLPLSHGGANKGRATKGAALALKARTLLYAASDQHDVATLKTKAPGFANFENPALLGYTSGDRAARWQAAKNAAKAVMDLGVYSLYKANPAPGDSTARNYNEIFLNKETSEDIYVMFFVTKNDMGWDNYNPGLYNGPNGYHNWGGNTPIGQVVDDYEMRDGTRFDWNNPQHAADPYKNRDPRLYASILYEGAQWRQRPSDVIKVDPKGIIQVGYWEKWNEKDQKVEVIPGLDTRKSPIEDWNGTYTGYYMRKFLDPSVDAQNYRQDLPWRYMRYAEVLLNYAEACLGLGQEEEAKTYINMIRTRAGMPQVTESGQALITRYQNERRVELAFEDHRYFDVRRWMIAPQAYTNATGVEPRYKLNPDKTTAAKPTYKIIQIQDRAWNDRAYFLPIKKDEINRNDKLVQNPLY